MFDKFEVVMNWKGLSFLALVMDTFSSICQIIAICVCSLDDEILPTKA